MFRKLLFIILLILAACSTVKIPVEPQAKIDADNHFRYALQMETNRDFSAAKESYIFLFESYRSFADTKGMLDCLSGLARIELENENEKAYLQYKNQTAEIIQNIAPELHRVDPTGTAGRARNLPVPPLPPATVAPELSSATIRRPLESQIGRASCRERV